MEIHTDEPKPLLKPFQCTICPKSFVHDSNLQEHILTKHVDDKTFQCTECFQNKQLTKFFATQKILNKHLKRAHGPPRFKCQVCFRTFYNSSHFGKHKQTHSQKNIKNHKCGICLKSFSFNSGLQVHLFSVHKQRREDKSYFKCEICSQEFVARCTLEKHVIRQHVADKAFECPVCSNTFIDQETLEKHMKAHDRQKRYFCDVCSKGFKMKRSLVHHLGVEHKKFFYCDKKCLRSFKNKPEFDEHISDSKQELKCYICQEIIDSECNLKIHTDSHVKEIIPDGIEIKIETNAQPKETGEPFKEESTQEFSLQNFQCELCFKTFDREAYLRAHRREVHSNDKWKCNFEQCSESFKWHNQLRLHKMKHAETKEFVCNTCQKAFYSPKQLKDHEQVHLEDKKFKCDICPKSFATSTQLRNHIANNHGGRKPFKCPFLKCGTSWASNNQLKDHLVSHQTERSFQCEMCTSFKAFKSRKQLKYHQKTVHLNAKTNKARKSRKSMDSQKHCEAVVFVCSSKMCSFETVGEAEVALHYNEKHGLPKVLIFGGRSSLPSFQLVQENRGSFAVDRMIQKRYKCGICSKLFKFPSLFLKHELAHSKQTPFHCSRCPKSFKYNNSLSRHILETHSSRSR